MIGCEWKWLSFTEIPSSKTRCKCTWCENSFFFPFSINLIHAPSYGGGLIIFYSCMFAISIFHFRFPISNWIPNSFHVSTHLFSIYFISMVCECFCVLTLSLTLSIHMHMYSHITSIATEPYINTWMTSTYCIFPFFNLVFLSFSSFP